MSEQADIRLLLVDDEASLREPLAEYLSRQGFVVTQAADAARARAMIGERKPDLVLLDIMMPGEDGLSLCRHLIEGKQLPVIFLTARGEATDRSVGLEIGADDYVVKPFSPRELVARIKAVLRRISSGAPKPERTGQRFSFDGWTLNTTEQKLFDPEGVLVPLSSGEFRMLEALVERAGHILTRDQLLDLTRGREGGPFDRAIDNQISRLRRKIEHDPKDPQHIKTIWGGGYRFSTAVTRL